MGTAERVCHQSLKENTGSPPGNGTMETVPSHTCHGVPAKVSCKLLNYIMTEPGTRLGKDVFIIPDLEDWLACLEGN